jgi:hypothetical protein
MYMLTILVFGFIGMSIAGITGAAKGQGLAGGAIVFMYGVITAGIALVCAIIFCYQADATKVKTANRVLAVLLALLLVVIAIRFFTMEEASDTSLGFSDYKIKPVTAIAPVELIHTNDGPETPLGLGFFKPDFHKNPKLYFYGEPNFEKPVQEHSPADSLVFKNLQEFSNYELIYAPPWLLPEHNKLDYDIFYLKLESVGRDFAEVILNNQTQRTGYVDRSAGEIIYWPEFLLRVFSVEFPPDKIQTIRFKPLDYSAEVKTTYDFMRPIEVKDDWLQVLLLDDDFKTVGNGWIQWRKDNKLIIAYSLLS